MIDLYYWPTPNGRKTSIMLEECGLPYDTIPVNIGRGEQFSAEFPAISPNNRIPAIVDRDEFGGLRRWFDTTKTRPAVRRGAALGRDRDFPVHTDAAARKVLFGQTAASIAAAAGEKS
jgi:hypothetical protein